MKNFDLVWAREHAGMTQAQVADLMGVNRMTVGRWETGKVRIPNRKWHALLKALEMTEAQLPKHREYDHKGYPMGFDTSPFADLDDAYEAEEAALEKLEGEEYPARARERSRLLFSKFTHGTPAERKEQEDAQMARYDKDAAEWEARRAASGRDLI